MILDDRQKYLVKHFLHIASNIKPRRFLDNILHFFIKKKKISGIYLYGDVGRGKTMLMQKFYSAVKVSKKMIHYQQFMQNIHKKNHNMQGRAADKIVQNLASVIAKRWCVLCIDEFEIKDITDAMIIMRLFRYLHEYGVFVFVTTNIKPNDLYKDGIQRIAFLPFITNINRYFQIFHLDSEIDYRLSAIENIQNRMFFVINSSEREEFLRVKSEICKQEELSETRIELFGRELMFKQAHNNVLFTDFSELFERDLGYSDYIEIAKKFKIIVLSSVRTIVEDENNVATRFINFIDNVYFNRSLLFVEINCACFQEIYPVGIKSKEFKRTISRLNEMNSENYLGT
jgi:cell division protein ZapE